MRQTGLACAAHLLCQADAIARVFLRCWRHVLGAPPHVRIGLLHARWIVREPTAGKDHTTSSVHTHDRALPLDARSDDTARLHKQVLDGGGRPDRHARIQRRSGQSCCKGIAAGGLDGTAVAKQVPQVRDQTTHHIGE